MVVSFSARASGRARGSSAAPVRRRGSIRQRGRATGEVRVFVGVDPGSAKRLYVSRSIRGTRRDAEVEFTKLLKQLDDGAIMSRSGSVGELVET